MSKVLALKYRPKKFEDVIGQDSISSTLSLSLDNKRLSHAYLFSGLRGSGKTSTARIFSKALLCDRGPTSTPCDECVNCKMANENRHIDIIEMDAASHGGKEDIKDIQEQARYKPTTARYKIFIIDEVHMLSNSAFNALLKTLEEPPEYVKFILATTDPLKLPATVLSRTQHFRFKKIPLQKVIHHLEHILNNEQIKYDTESLDILSRSGNGSLRDTLTLLDQAIIYSKGNIDIASITDMLGLVDPHTIESIFDIIFRQDLSALKSKIKMLSEYESEMVVDEFIAYLKEKMFEDSKFSMVIIDRFFRVLNESKSLLSNNADSTFVISLMLFKMVEAMKMKSIDNVIASLEKSSNTPQTIPQTQPTPQETQDNQKTNITQPQIKNRFEILQSKIIERNYDIGECFKNSITYESYENSTLSWRSSADGDCKQMLKNHYTTIKNIVYDVYGFDTTIKMLKSDTLPQPPTIQQNKPIDQANKANHSHSQQTPPIDITQHPLVQKTEELFGINQIRIEDK